MGSTVYMGRMLRISLVLLGISYAAASVSYDYRGVTINGHRKILISGAIHYPRSTPEMWPDLIWKAKAGGVDVIETYVFWNGHEPSPGNYNFQGRYDLIGFLRAVQKAGLYAMVRIGPFVCAEWNFGGFPVWLKYVPRIEFRTDNEPFKAEMQKFTEKIVGMLKAENMFQPQGGPIILSQIENEYDLVEGGLGAAGKRYAYWAANMAEGLGTGVPWVMCKQADAPGAVINTWNGYYADEFYPNGHSKPRMWTENWSGWYTAFGKAAPYRPVQDVAYAVARFIGRGGSFVNYYMYHGGTNFGRTAGGPFIATSYDYDSPIDEYGLLREPKWGHLRDLHKAIKQCEPALVSADPKYTKLGDKQEAHVYWSNTACAAFLSNYDPTYPVTVTYQNMPYLLPPWSVSILPDCKTVAFNTAKVNVQASHMKMNPIDGEPFSWQSYNDWAATALDKDAVSMKWLQDQTSLTKDTTDYLWYMTKVQINSEKYKRQVLTVDSAGHVLHVFINGQYSGTAYGNIDNPKLRYSATINMKLGTNTISLLSCTMGLPNVGFKFETWNAGVLGPVKLGALDLTKYPWSYKVGLSGEKLGIFWPAGSSSVRWAQGSWLSINHPLTWYKGTLNLPAGNDPLALDMSSMGKGQIWVNGNHVGRYWVTNKAQGNCQTCNYAGTFSETKCLSNCGQASQKWYHVPRSWLMPTGNLVVVLEEIGGDPTKISLVTRTL